MLAKHCCHFILPDYSHHYSDDRLLKLFCLVMRYAGGFGSCPEWRDKSRYNQKVIIE
jgi:hypothetical protein